MSLKAVLCPRPPRAARGVRFAQVATRTVHIAAMGVLLGGIAWHAPERALAGAMATTVASGALLLALDLWKSCDYVHQGNGVAVLVKLALLGLGNLVPAARFDWYLAATVVASVGSHMPRAWRHWSLLERRVIG